jgi:hypothetical protein
MSSIIICGGVRAESLASHMHPTSAADTTHAGAPPAPRTSHRRASRRIAGASVSSLHAAMGRRGQLLHPQVPRLRRSPRSPTGMAPTLACWLQRHASGRRGEPQCLAARPTQRPPCPVANGRQLPAAGWIDGRPGDSGGCAVRVRCRGS